MAWRDQLQAHRQPGGAEARRHADGGQARQGRQDGDFHPAVVRVHRAAGDLGGPTQGGVEGPALGRRQREEVELVEQRDQALVHLGAHRAGREQVGAAERAALVVFPQRLGLDALAVARVAAIAGPRR